MYACSSMCLHQLLLSGYRARKASARDDDETSASNAKQGRSEESIQQKREKRREVLERRKRKPDYQATGTVILCLFVLVWCAIWTFEEHISI